MSFLLLFLTLFSFVSSELQRGFAYNEFGFNFLGKFCFGYTPPADNTPSGHISISLHYHARNLIVPPQMQLLIFDDEAHSWPAVYDGYWATCQSSYGKAIMAIPVNFNGKGEFHFETNIFEHIRPRFWYVALVNCKRIYGITYSIHWTNPNTEFSVNEQGMWTTHVIFLSIAGVVLALYVGVALKTIAGREAFTNCNTCITALSGLPPVHALFLSGLLALVAGLAFELGHLSLFAINGFGLPLLSAFAVILKICSQLLLAFLLLLLSQGWCISTEKVENKLIAYMMAGVGACYILLMFWAAGRDRASTVYVYDSLPGYILILIDLIGGFYFAYSIYHTRKGEPDVDKKRFYFLLGTIYVSYFMYMAIIVPIASAIAPWAREKAVFIIQMIVGILSYTGMLYFVWPGNSDLYFKVAGPKVSEEYDSLLNEANL